jgi:hypothetical protein
MARHDWATAERHFSRALKLREQSLGEDHPLVAQSLISHSAALRKLNRKKEAKNELARANQILAVRKYPAYLANTVDVRSFRK